MGETVEHFFTKAFIAQLAIEALDEAVLLRLAGCDIVPGDGGFVLPFEDGATGQFAAIVQAQRIGPAVHLDELLHEADRPLAGDRGSHLDAKSFSVAVVEHVERAEPAPVVERVVHEVQ